MSRTLGMEFISTPEPDTAMARMKVDDRNKQPFGFLSGGATLALAENLAGVAVAGTLPRQNMRGHQRKRPSCESGCLWRNRDRLRSPEA